MEIPHKLTPQQQQMMMDLERDAFPGIGAVDEQTLVPLTRFGKMFWYKVDNDERPIAVAEVMRSYNEPNSAYIFGYYVRSDWQGKGIGKQFLQQVIAQITADNFTAIVLTVDVTNSAAIKLYEKLGFTIEETRAHEFGENENRYYMRLHVSEA